MIIYTNVDINATTTATPTNFGPNDTSAYVINENEPTTINPWRKVTPTTDTSYSQFDQYGPRCSVGEPGVEGSVGYDENSYRPPTRVARIKIPLAKRRTLSGPMVECYWARGPPKKLITLYFMEDE